MVIKMYICWGVGSGPCSNGILGGSLLAVSFRMDSAVKS